MSTFFSWQHAILKSQLEPTTKLVCLTIGCHMALDGTGCFPSYALIAEESGLGRRTVIDHVQKAVDAGYLRLEHRERENGSSTSNLYQPTMPGVVQEPHQGGAPAALGVVQELHPHNTPSLTTQLSNPSVSPQPTKASRRGSTPAIRLEEFLRNSGEDTRSNYFPPIEWGQWAHKQFGWDEQREGREWVDFYDYWTSGNAVHGGRKADWFATWRSHCRRSANRGGGGSSRSGLDRGLAGAMCSSVAQRHGAAQPGGYFGGRAVPGKTKTDDGGDEPAIPAGEIPF